MSRTLFTILIFLAFQITYAQDCAFDSIPPSIKVKPEITIGNRNSVRITINAEIFDDRSFDNCSDTEHLRFSFSSNPFDIQRVFNRVNREGQELEIWVTDEMGNQSSQTVLIKQNYNGCEEDDLPPTVYLPKYIYVGATGANSEVIFISSFELGAYSWFDNCTEKKDIIVSFSPDSVEIKTTVPSGNYQETPVELWFTDQAGNQTFATATVIVQERLFESGCTLEVELSDVSNCENNTTSIFSKVIGGRAPYSYNWNFIDVPIKDSITTNDSISINKNLINVSSGLYSVTVTDASNCQVIKQKKAGFFTQSVGFRIQGQGEEVEIFVTGLGGTKPYSYNWSDGISTLDSNRVAMPPGDYEVTIVDSEGCFFSQEFHAFFPPDLIRGRLFIDKDATCEFDNSDLGIRLQSKDDFVVELVKDKTLDTDITLLNNYQGSLPVKFKESYYVEGLLFQTSFLNSNNIRFSNLIYQLPNVETDYKFLKFTSRFNNCEPTYIPIEALGETVLPDVLFPIGTEENCIQLETSLSTPFLRRCFPNKYDINYCNYSISTIEDVYLEIELDEYLNLLSSPVGYTDLGENKYRFDVGVLEAGECGRFSLEVEVSCEAVLGQTHCSNVEIFPESTCNEPDANWSGASLEVEGICNDEEVIFKISNAGNGNMNSTSDYVVVEDVVMFSRDNFQLNTGESIEVKVPANGSTYRINVNQVEGHPGNNLPTVAVEGCGTNEQGKISLGFVNQFPENDTDRNKDIDCQENIGSYDPNDKLAIPSGVGENHLIEENTDIEYTIRFQNTGTDTAFTVVVLDTLSSVLNPNTIQLMSSSHPYRFDLLQGNVMRFRFDNILLPDSTTNEPASNGYIRFKISQDANLVDGTIIENSAAIYFDFNEPIITNTYFHVVGFELAQTVNTQNRYEENSLVEVYPNPFSEKTLIRINQLGTAKVKLELFNAFGTKVWGQNITDTKYLFDRSTLSAGLYFMKVTIDQQATDVLQLVIAE